MPAQNVFSGVIMEYGVVEHWRTYPGFNHFVFQQAIDDVEVGNFTLIAYAVTVNLIVLNSGNVIKTNESNYNSFTGTKPNIQFANMNLGWEALNSLYPAGGTKSDLLVYPAGEPGPYYKNTAYVQYVAETGNGTEFLVKNKINPSPPA